MKLNRERKKIFILGGSALQKDLVRAAKKRYFTIVLDGNPNCVLKNEADSFINLDFSNTQELSQLASIERPFMILTMASEPGNLAAAIVSDELGLKYNPLDVVLTTINKVKMKNRLVDLGISTADFIVVGQDNGFASLAEGMRYPVVVKPSQSSAGRGVRLAKNDSDLEVAVESAKSLSRDGCALLEEYIEGLQYSVETASCKGVHNIIGITREYFGPPPYFAETQHLFPANLDDDLERRIREFTLKVVEGMGIQFGASHIEIRVTSERQLYVIEVASRMGGLRSELMQRALGLKYADLLLQSYELPSISVEPTSNYYSLVKMIFSEADLKRQKELHKRAEYEVSPITWLKSEIEGCQTSLMDSAGYYFIKAENLEDAENAL